MYSKDQVVSGSYAKKGAQILVAWNHVHNFWHQTFLGGSGFTHTSRALLFTFSDTFVSCLQVVFVDRL